jgi:3-deoxy-7-phosphoheptulonate synthase
VGGGGLVIRAGPAAVETGGDPSALAASLKERGVSLLWGGAMRPGQSPYAFRGTGEEGLRCLAAAGKAAGLSVVSEVPSVAEVGLIASYVDALEIGPFNMRNFGLLEAAAATDMPILLHRGLSATIDEWLLSAEHVLHAGNDRVVLCESGIRSYDGATSATLDVSAVPVLKELTHLPVLVNPARGTGRADLVERLALAAIAAGADGLAIEVHSQPGQALVDGSQSLPLDPYGEMVRRVEVLALALDRPLQRA